MNGFDRVKLTVVIAASVFVFTAFKCYLVAHLYLYRSSQLNL